MLQVEEERNLLREQLWRQEKDQQELMEQLRQHVTLKEQALAAEFAEVERSHRETEHVLREELDEKKTIIQVCSLRKEWLDVLTVVRHCVLLDPSLVSDQV